MPTSDKLLGRLRDESGALSALVHRLLDALRERAARLRGAGEDQARDFLDSQLNKVQSILVEKTDAGRSAHYAPVRIVGAPARPGAVLARRAARREGQLLIAGAAA